MDCIRLLPIALAVCFIRAVLIKRPIEEKQEEPYASHEKAMEYAKQLGRLISC